MALEWVENWRKLKRILAKLTNIELRILRILQKNKKKERFEHCIFISQPGTFNHETLITLVETFI